MFVEDMNGHRAFKHLIVGTPKPPAAGFGEQVYEPITTSKHVAWSDRLMHARPLDGSALWGHCKRIDPRLGKLLLISHVWDVMRPR